MNSWRGGPDFIYAIRTKRRQAVRVFHARIPLDALTATN